MAEGVRLTIRGDEDKDLVDAHRNHELVIHADNSL